MSEEANAAELQAESEKALVTIERENAIVQIAFGAVMPKLPHENYALSILAELPHGQGTQTILEGPARAFLDLAAWVAAEGILNRDASLRTPTGGYTITCASRRYRSWLSHHVRQRWPKAPAIHRWFCGGLK